MAWKGGNLSVPAIAFQGEAGQVRPVEYVPREIRSRIRTVVHLSAVDHPFSPVVRKPFTLHRPAALRDVRHFSAWFNLRKMPAVATHRSIRTDLPRLSIPNTCPRVYASSFPPNMAFCHMIQIVSQRIVLRSLRWGH